MKNGLNKKNRQKEIAIILLVAFLVGTLTMCFPWPDRNSDNQEEKPPIVDMTKDPNPEQPEDKNPSENAQKPDKEPETPKEDEEDPKVDQNPEDETNKPEEEPVVTPTEKPGVQTKPQPKPQPKPQQQAKPQTPTTPQIPNKVETQKPQENNKPVVETPKEETQKIVVIKVDDKSSVYGDRIKNLTFKVVSGATQEEADKFVSLWKDMGKTAGTYKIKAFSEKADWKLEVTEGTYTIERRVVTIRVDNKQSKVGSKLNELTYQLVSGSILEEDGEIIKLSTNATGQKEGSFPITVQVLNPNYDVRIQAGTYTVGTKASSGGSSGGGSSGGGTNPDPGPGPVDPDPGPGPVDPDPGPGPVDPDPGPGPVDPDPGPGPVDPDPGPGPVDPDPGPGPVDPDPDKDPPQSSEGTTGSDGEEDGDINIPSGGTADGEHGGTTDEGDTNIVEGGNKGDGDSGNTGTGDGDDGDEDLGGPGGIVVVPGGSGSSTGGSSGGSSGSNTGGNTGGSNTGGNTTGGGDDGDEDLGGPGGVVIVSVGDSSNIYEVNMTFETLTGTQGNDDNDEDLGGPGGIVVVS